MLHILSQYGARFRDDAIRLFHLDRGAGVLALADGGPAARAGLRLDDVILSVDGESLGTVAPGEAGFPRLYAMLGALERAMVDGGADLVIDRDGRRETLRLAGQEGCAGRFILESGGFDAGANADYVRLTVGAVNFAQGDDELAYLLGHEFAHVILGHRARLDAAGIQRGLLQHFGRSARLTRETEIEADRLSLYLMERAGYDPEAAIRFLDRQSREMGGVSGTHPSGRDRVAIARRELATLRRLQAERAPLRPDFLRP